MAIRVLIFHEPGDNVVVCRFLGSTIGYVVIQGPCRFADEPEKLEKVLLTLANKFDELTQLSSSPAINRPISQFLGYLQENKFGYSAHMSVFGKWYMRHGVVHSLSVIRFLESRVLSAEADFGHTDIIF